MKTDFFVTEETQNRLGDESYQRFVRIEGNTYEMCRLEKGD